VPVEVAGNAGHIAYPVKAPDADCLLGRIHLSAMNADTQGQG